MYNRIRYPCFFCIFVDMNNLDKIIYEEPLCRMIRLQHRESIALCSPSPLMHILMCTDAANPVPVVLEDLDYEDF